MRTMIMAGLWVAAAAALSSMPASGKPFPATPTATPPVLNLAFKADVQADGTPVNIEPDASLRPALQALVRKRVAEWRYVVGSWQGKPMGQSISQRIVAEALPVASGGFVLRVKEVSDASTVIKMDPPVYPLDARRNGIMGDFIYSMRVDSQGKPYDIELLSPEHPDRGLKMLDQAGRTAIALGTLSMPKVDQVPVDCRVVIPIQFWIDSKPKQPMRDLAPYRASQADMCPAPPQLVTKVVGILL